MLARSLLLVLGVCFLILGVTQGVTLYREDDSQYDGFLAGLYDADADDSESAKIFSDALTNDEEEVVKPDVDDDEIFKPVTDDDDDDDDDDGDYGNTLVLPPYQSPSGQQPWWYNRGRGRISAQAKKPDICEDPKMDAITRVADGSTYVFKGDHYWEIKCYGIVSGFPKPISASWPGLPNDIDSAVTIINPLALKYHDDTFFFKGGQYWRFWNNIPRSGYPKPISEGFPGIPDDIDAVMQWSGNRKIYFFKGNRYWRFDPLHDPHVTDNYPRTIELWTGIPKSGIDAAFQWQNDLTYFFKDDRYYRYDDATDKVDLNEKPAYPRGTKHWWFNCPGATNETVPEPGIINQKHHFTFSFDPVD